MGRLKATRRSGGGVGGVFARELARGLANAIAAGIGALAVEVLHRLVT